MPPPQAKRRRHAAGSASGKGRKGEVASPLSSRGLGGESKQHGKISTRSGFQGEKYDDDDVASSSSGGEGNKNQKRKQSNDIDDASDGDEFFDNFETAEEARLRLARGFLANMAEQVKTDALLLTTQQGDQDAEDVSDDEQKVRFALSAKLQEHTASLSWKTRKRFIAASLHGVSVAAKDDGTSLLLHTLRGHEGSVTSVVVSSDGSRVYSVGKDCTVNMWNVEDGKMLHRVRGQRRQKGKPGNGPIKPAPLTSQLEAQWLRDAPDRIHNHSGHILAVALSTDGRFLVTAGSDRYIKVWDGRSLKFLDSMQGHRARITSLAFRLNSTQLYSASDDRTLKVWDAQALMYIDTLHGHQSQVSAVDAAWKERCLSGGFDSTARIWKINDETQLVYKAAKRCGSADAVALITEELFVTGGDDGNLNLWSWQKKRPIAIVRHAHGVSSRDHEGSYPWPLPPSTDGDDDATPSSAAAAAAPSYPNWISAIAACKNTDLVASGSCDGVVRLWRVSARGLECVLTLPAIGFVNSLAFDAGGTLLAVGCGREHKLGTWSRIKNARDCIRIFRLPTKDMEARVPSITRGSGVRT